MRGREPKFKLHNLMFLYIATTILVSVISLSKYTTAISSDSIARVAVMVNSVSVDIELPIGAYPGVEPIICPIIITNKEEEKICEVTQEFKIQIDIQKNIPLELGLYKDKFCTEIIEKNENGEYISEDFKFNAGIEDTKTYYLKIEWPEEEKSEYLAFEIDYISISVVSAQIN